MGGAFMGGPDACVPVTGTPVIMSLRISRESLDEHAADAAAASCHNAGTARIHPLAEIGISATAGQPCTRSEHARGFFACLDGPDRPGSSHPFTG